MWKDTALQNYNGYVRPVEFRQDEDLISIPRSFGNVQESFILVF